MIGIYKITNLVTNEIYIGSSVNIKHRWSNHRSHSTWKHCPDSKLYQDFQTYGLDSFEFSVIENCEKENLRAREDFYIQSLQPEYNLLRAYNPDCLKNYQKTYYSQLCNYKGETLKLSALTQRFSKQGTPHPTQEAKKYLAS